MSNETVDFNKMNPITYKLMLISFDDEYYYGQIYREYENGDRNPLKQFVGNVRIDLDPAIAEAPEVHLMRRNTIDIGTYIDFGIDPSDKMRHHLLSDAIADKIDVVETSMIPRVLKREGGTYTKYLIVNKAL